MTRVRRRFALLCLGLVSLSGCARTPPPSPFLGDEALAVKVIRPSQTQTLRVARICQPMGVAAAPNDAALMREAAARGANLVEVLYESTTATAVLHQCPDGYDPVTGHQALGEGTNGSSVTTETLSIH